MKNTKYINNSHVEDTEAEIVRKMMVDNINKLRDKIYITVLRERIKKAQMVNQLLGKK